MRAIVSALLLLAQLHPLVGVALCQGLADTRPGLMEDGCPMPDPTDRVTQPRPDRSSGPVLTSVTSLHDCVFAEACLNPSSAVIPAKLAFRSPPPPHDLVFRTVSSLHGSDELPPPIPPPNL